MNVPVFLATLGQRPEAITMALDQLLPRYRYTEVALIHTDPARSGIAEALVDVMDVFRQDYPELTVHNYVLRHADGQPLIDISDQVSAEVYYHSILGILRDYRVRYMPIHLLVAGGRKAMSIYAALAAALLSGEHDHVWTVHTPPELMVPGHFHAPAGMRDQVRVIQLPVIPSRLLPGVMATRDIDELIRRARTSPRQHFLQSLTDQERRLAELLYQHPYAENGDLGNMLDKAPKTIENQLRNIYQKLATSFDLPLDHKHKRKMLLDVLGGRV